MATTEQFNAIHPIKRTRLASGMTQRQLADALDTTAMVVCGWESGRVRPDPRFYPKLAEVLGLTPAEVVEMFYPSH